MSTRSEALDPGVAAAIREAERPKTEDCLVTGLGRADRLWTSPWLDRLLPLWLWLWLGSARGRWRWRRDHAGRIEALRFAVFVAGRAAGRRELRRLARAALVEATTAREVGRRPRGLDRMEVEGGEHLEAARAGGRGVVVISAHVGSKGFSTALADHAGPMYIITGRNMSSRIFTGLDGHHGLQCYRHMERIGYHLVAKGHLYEVVRALLERGETCFMSADVRGRAPAVLFGHSVTLASGPALLARATGCTVVPVFALREGRRRYVSVHAPVEPSRFDSAAELHAHLAAILDGVMGARPEQCFPPPSVLRAHPDYPSRREVRELEGSRAGRALRTVAGWKVRDSKRARRGAGRPVP